MWAVTLLLLVGVAVAMPGHDQSSHQHAWETGNEYQYLVRSRTLAGLDKLKEQYTGVQLKGILIIQVKSPEMLLARLSNPQYAHIHKTLMNGPESEITDQQLEYRPIPMSGKPFEVKLKHGVIRDISVNRDVPTWELNILKAMMSQLQIDTQGENALDSSSNEIPVNENSPVMFKAMEDSVGGKCEVLYDITPLSESMVQQMPEKIPFPQFGNGKHCDVKKVKNYQKCQQRQVYHYGVNDPWKRKHNEQEEILSQLSESQMVISGNLKRFTIQSSVTKNQISVKPKKSDPFLGTVYTITRLTLVKKNKSFNDMMGSEESNNLESTGNLVYAYNNPFSESENRRERRPSISWNSAQVQSSESSSSSSQNSRGGSSSSSSSSEEHDISNVQSKAALHLAPNVPLLPLFIGYKGKSIQMSEQVDVVSRALNLIDQIASELQLPVNPSATLEKYIMLKNLLRILNHEQYDQLERLVLSQKGGSDSPVKYKNMWSTLRDAVTQAATGPALLTIVNWLKNQKVEGVEAARILSQIPKNVHVPTEDYLKTFFELVDDPRVSQQRYVNVSAPLALAELIYNSHAKSRFYPTRSFGPMILKDNNDIVEQYIPYLEKQLKQGFLESNSVKIQTYIMALGRTGHPKILPIFEPYLEGTQSASKFQRLLIVASLSNLARIQPKLVGPIFYKLYFDTRENNEIRALAVHQFITTDPPLITLQRIAKYTNYDKSEVVNSVVASTIESIANKNRSKWQDLASKARSVRNLLNTSNHTTSVGYYKDIENWFFKELYLQTVADSDNSVPVFLRFGVNTILDFLGQPTMEAGYATSNIRQLFHKIDNLNWNEWDQEQANEKSMQESQVEELVQALGIKSEHLNKLEGNVYVNTPYGLLFYPFDSNTLESIPNELKNLFKKGDKAELTAFNNYETTISFPTELGLPFVYTFESPTVTKYEIEWRKGASSGQKRYGVINAMFASKIEKRFGFVTPFEHQNYIAGIDKTEMVQIPVEYEVTEDHRNHGLKIRPNSQQTQMNSQLTLLHHSTVPFTTRQNILALEPVSLDRNTHHIMTSKKHKATMQKDMFSIQLEFDRQEGEENNSGDQIREMLWRMRELNNNHYKKLDISMNVQQGVKNEFNLNVVYDNMEVEATYNDNAQQSHGIGAEVFPIDDSKPNSKDRRHQIMKGLSRGLQSGKVHVIDMYYDVPTSQKRQVFSVGLVKSNVDQKSKAYVYFNSQTQKSQETLNELCYIQEVQFSPNTPLDFEYMAQNAPADYFRAELLYGKSCKEGQKIVVVGNATRSKQMQEMMENSQVTKQCRQDIQKGHKASPSCQKAIALAQIRDQYEVSINANEFVQKIINKFIEYMTHFLTNIQMKVTDSRTENSQTNAVSAKVNISPFHGTPRVQLHTPQVNVTFPEIMEKQTLKETEDEIDNMNRMQVQKDSCTLDKDEISTFDKRVYHVDKLVTDHVLVITNEQKDPENNHMSVAPNVAILARDASDGKSRIITILLANLKIELKKLDNRLQIFVEGKQIKNNKYQYRSNGKSILEIYTLPDGSIQVRSDEYGFTVVYDGERLQIWVPDNYHNSIHGLCGNYDSDSSNDFLTPKNCIWTNPEEFTVTYALIDKNSPGYILENKRKVEQAQQQCKLLSSEQHYRRNVISDREAGRMLTEDKNWGYHQDNLKRGQEQGHGYNNRNQEGRPDQRHNIIYRTRVVEEGEEICFTTRPVPMCREGTRPMERKPKMYKLYCQPRNEESQATKHRVEQGANPDFTRKPVSKSHVFQVPSVCSAA